MAYIWQLWPGRGWPHTPQEERALVRSWLRQSEGREGAVRRDALIVALGGLRSGSSTEELSRVAPALGPADLYASYQHLDRLRAEAAAHMARVCEADTETAFRRHARGASVLCPVPVGLLRRTVRVNGLAAVADAGARVQARCVQVRREADEIMAQLPAAADPVELGRLLFDPYTPGLWGDPYFVAARVGELTPVRVRTLLGEEADSDLIFTDVYEIGRDLGRVAGGDGDSGSGRGEGGGL